MLSKLQCHSIYIIYLKSQVKSNDKVGKSIEKREGLSHRNVKDLLIAMFWLKQSLVKLETSEKNLIFNWQGFSAVMWI